MQPDQIRFPVLTSERYLTAVDSAKESVRKRLELPKLEDYRAATPSKYPPSFIKGILAVLFIVMAFSFWVSAGKQTATNGLIFDGLPTKFNHLSTFWSDTSIIFMLFLSELGTILFLVASGTIAEVAPKTLLFKREINITELIFKGFAFLCASYAIVGNVTATVLDPISSASVMQWLMAIGIPVMVLGLGLLLEKIIIDSIRVSSDQKIQFHQAQIEYQRAVKSPESHPTYNICLFDAIYGELTRYKGDKTKLAAILPVVESNQDAKKWLVVSEYQAHAQMADFSLSAGAINPFLLQQQTATDE